MQRVRLGHPQAHFSEILAQIESGTEIIITRRGQPVAKLSSIKAPRKPIDFKVLDLLPSRQRVSPIPSVQLIRKMRDEKY